jgi:hypothetical protein
MRYASEDFVANLYGRYSPAKQMIKNRRREEMEKMEAEKLEMEAREAEKSNCGCKDMKGVGNG